MDDLAQLIADYQRMLSKSATETERQHWQSRIDVLVAAQEKIAELEKEVAKLRRRIALGR
jgi:hypothetical protein